MAVCRDYYDGNTHIIIHDDNYAHLSLEERIKILDRIAQKEWEIYCRDFLKKYERQQAAKEEAEKAHEA